MPVLDVHLDLPGRAGDVGQIRGPFSPDARVADQIDRRRTHCTDNRADRQHTQTGAGRRPRTAVKHTRFTESALAERDEEQEKGQLKVRGSRVRALASLPPRSLPGTPLLLVPGKPTGLMMIGLPDLG